jgi:Carboxypeptidase regulatory-like domain
MLPTLLLLWFMVTAQTPQAAVGSVEGVVVDQRGKPIQGADVYALPEEDTRRPVASTTTDFAGKFLFHDIPAVRVYIYAYKDRDG